MSADVYDRRTILEALRLTGERLDWPRPVEIVIAGGAAGMLLGIWRGSRMTEDCDIVEISPPQQPRRALLQAAGEVAEKMSLDSDWLNDHFMTFGTLDTLPNCWRERCVRIGIFGKLEVTSLGRIDLVAMKLYAGRPQDMEDIESQIHEMTQSDWSFLKDYLDSLSLPHRKHIKKPQLQRAYELLSTMEERWRK